MNKITYSELRDKMFEHNRKHDIKSKGVSNKPVLKAVVVFTQDSFSKIYPLESRSYLVTNENKGFIDGMISNSVFGDALDGTDDGVRLDWYMYDENPWKVDYCYILEES